MNAHEDPSLVGWPGFVSSSEEEDSDFLPVGSWEEPYDADSEVDWSFPCTTPPRCSPEQKQRDEVPKNRLYTKTNPRTLKRRRSTLKGERLGVDGHMYRRMKRFGLLWWLLAMLALLAADPALNNTQDLHLVEYFAGVEAITKAFEIDGMHSAAYDIKKHRDAMNINSDLGWLHGLHQCRRLVPFQSLAWFATVCSTWVWMPRSSAHRSERIHSGTLDLHVSAKRI